MGRAVSVATLRVRTASARERLGIGLWGTVRRFAAPGNFAACVRKVPTEFPYQQGKVFLKTI